MTRSTLIAAAAAALMLGTALPAAASGAAMNFFPNLTWPETAPDTSTLSKDCVETATASGPACLPAGQ